jgi:hypothetical protein
MQSTLQVSYIFLCWANCWPIEGVAVFDLTPGENSYKDELATDYDLTYDISIYSNLSDHLKFTLVEHLKKTMFGIGINSAALQKIKRRILIFREKIVHAKKEGLLFSIKSIIRQVGLPGEARKYVAQPEEIRQHPDLLFINKNNLLDLLQVKTQQTLTTRRDFLENAMHRFQSSQSVYTYCRDKLLLCCVWISYDDSSTSSGSLLQGFYCHPSGQTLLQSFLVTVASAVTAERKESPIYAITTSSDRMYKQTLEAIGFKSSALPGH